MTITTITKKITTLEAVGTHTRPNCKPVLCIDNGTIYSSVTDAANANNTTLGNMSAVVTGKSKTCKGKRFCLVSNMPDYVEEIAQAMFDMSKKAKAYDEIIEREEMKRKANEELDKRAKEYEDAIVNLDKAERLFKEAKQKVNEL